MMRRPSYSLRSRLEQILALAGARTRDIRQSADRALRRLGRIPLRMEVLGAIAQREQAYQRMQEAEEDLEMRPWPVGEDELLALVKDYELARGRTEELVDLLLDGHSFPDAAPPR